MVNCLKYRVIYNVIQVIFQYIGEVVKSTDKTHFFFFYLE